MIAPVAAPRVDLVILAAGGSRRFGGCKLAQLIAGKPLLVHALDAALQALTSAAVADESRLWVVLGGWREALQPIVPAHPRLSVLYNADWQLGIAHSIHCAISALPTTSDAALIAPADLPASDARHVLALIDRFIDGHQRVASHYAGTNGSPALFARRYFADLMATQGDNGAGALLRDLPPQSVVNLPQGEIDIDTPDDFSRLTVPDAR
ncbi:nucleotidyltransferase family protein [Gammaproteobacteria bacterium]|nr:nucleotidyltransferase family protein [Gammaproteobacteria bacterium]